VALTQAVGVGCPPGLQDRQRRAALRLDGSIPSPLQWRECPQSGRLSAHNRRGRAPPQRSEIPDRLCRGFGPSQDHRPAAVRLPGPRPRRASSARCGCLALRHRLLALLGRPAAAQVVLAEIVGDDNHWKIAVVQSPIWRPTSWARAGPSGRASQSTKKLHAAICLQRVADVGERGAVGQIARQRKGGGSIPSASPSSGWAARWGRHVGPSSASTTWSRADAQIVLAVERFAAQDRREHLAVTG
jgi:hypothetical protein